MKALQKKILNALGYEIDSAILPESKNLFKNELSIYFTDNSEIQTLNKTYRKKNKPTDVLSFMDLHHSLGEIVISIEKLTFQAKKFRTTNDLEMLRLLIHSTLHLIGYDHEKVPARIANKMRKKEKLLFDLLKNDSSFSRRNYFIIPSPAVRNNRL